MALTVFGAAEVAYYANRPALRRADVTATIPSMFFLHIVFQIVSDWCRDFLVDLSGDRITALFSWLFRRKRHQPNRPRNTSARTHAKTHRQS
jgi:hypothetical protein